MFFNLIILYIRTSIADAPMKVPATVLRSAIAPASVFVIWSLRRFSRGYEHSQAASDMKIEQ